MSIFPKDILIYYSLLCTSSAELRRKYWAFGTEMQQLDGGCFKKIVMATEEKILHLPPINGN